MILILIHGGESSPSSYSPVLPTDDGSITLIKDASGLVSFPYLRIAAGITVQILEIIQVSIRSRTGIPWSRISTSTMCPLQVMSQNARNTSSAFPTGHFSSYRPALQVRVTNLDTNQRHRPEDPFMEMSLEFCVYSRANNTNQEKRSTFTVGRHPFFYMNSIEQKTLQLITMIVQEYTK